MVRLLGQQKGVETAGGRADAGRGPPAASEAVARGTCANVVFRCGEERIRASRARSKASASALEPRAGAVVRARFGQGRSACKSSPNE